MPRAQALVMVAISFGVIIALLFIVPPIVSFFLKSRDRL